MADMVQTKEKILVAMSGGVDSSVAAALLKQEGYDVVGVTLKLWGGESDSGCCSVSDVEDARRVAKHLDIEHHVFNFGEEFTEHVVEPYVKDHEKGLTPNPCVECNRHIKFAKLYKRADALGIKTLATGHHAKIEIDEDGFRRVTRGHDSGKDQSYVLHMLDQTQLERLMLPIGDLHKDDVRKLAETIDLKTASKPDSQDVCFIHSKGGRQVFLGDRIPLKPAVIVNSDGEKLGDLDSIELVTLGQRRGLKLGGESDRKYVTEIDHENQRVTVGEKSDLLVRSQVVRNFLWSGDPITDSFDVQCSAHGDTRKATKIVDLDDDRFEISWIKPEQKVAAGQSIAFYRGDKVVAGAIAE